VTLVVVTGTGTEIGKTWMTAACARALRGRGAQVAARKPVQSFDEGTTAPTDADVLAAATGQAPHDVCPEHRWLPLAMAPPMAARALGRPGFTIADLIAEIGDAPPATTLLVESAGGARSPLADDGDTVDLVRALHPALVVVVADAGLGTINLVRLTVDALAPQRVTVYLNHFDALDPLHAANLDWLATREGLEAVTDIEALVDRIVASSPVTG